MRSNKKTTTFLIHCKDKNNCKTVLDSLGKKHRRSIRAVHKTIPFTNPEKVKSKLPNTVHLGLADFIVEVVTKRNSELDNIKKDFETELSPRHALLTVA